MKVFECIDCKKEFLKPDQCYSALRCDKCNKERRKVIQRNYDDIRVEKKKVVLEPDEIIYMDYKEPVRKVEDGFGYYGVVAMNKDKSLIQCHYCGGFYKVLSCAHLKSHGLTAPSYKKEYKLGATTALISETIREERIKNYGNLFSTNKNLQEAQQKFISYMKEKKNGSIKSVSGHIKGNSPWNLERRNKEGLCPDQLLQQIRVLEKELGHVPSLRDFRRYNTRYTHAIMTAFGTWTKAVSLAGYLPLDEKLKQKFEPEKLLAYMREFYDTYKRTPMTSDFGRGLLPSYRTYRNKFGTLNNARTLAGVPLMERIVGPFGKWVWREIPEEENGNTIN